MARGGKREGAGRPIGAQSRIEKEVKERAAKTGEMPIEYMLRVMRDKRADKGRRDEMAKAAAPYLHSKMPTAIVTPPPPKQAMNQDDDAIMAQYMSGIHDEAEQG